MSYTDPVPLPGPRSINSGLSAARVETMVKILGWPRKRFDTECRPLTNPLLRPQMVTANVGPFRVTGLKAATESLRKVMADIRKADPKLYEALGSAGMLCARYVRGSYTRPSNHSWGTAIDLTVDGRLDQPGDGKVMRGLLLCYKHFHRHGWYWGAAFRVEDAMHFEVADETIRSWHLQGKV